MGIIWQGILGGVSGRVGNVIGSSWEGIPVLKSRPLSVANPRTTQQVHYRDRLTKLVAIASSINSSIIIDLQIYWLTLLILDKPFHLCVE